MSGSGIVFAPATAVAPRAQFRIQVGRFDYLRQNLFGFNVVELNGGLSSHLEAYIKLYAEQTGVLASSSSLGVGAKLRMPFRIPVVDDAAVWAESVSSPQIDSLTTLPQNIIRTGIISGFKFWNFQSTLFAGFSKMQSTIEPIGGAGIILPVNNSARIGGELFYNYFGRKDIQGLFTGSVRIFSNVSIQLSAGYTSSKELSSWLMTGGLSIATADLDFHPKTAPPPPPTVPSIEEMEKLSLQDKGIGQTIKDQVDGGTGITNGKKPEQKKENQKEEPKK